MKDAKLIFKTYENSYLKASQQRGIIVSPKEEALFLAVEASDLIEYCKSFNKELENTPRYVNYPYDNVCIAVMMDRRVKEVMCSFQGEGKNIYTTSTVKQQNFDQVASLITATIDFMNAKTTLIGQKEYTILKGSGREKIVPITYVRSTTKQYANDEVTRDRGIVWSHSWNVIGHWRRIEGKGKDRNGLYNQENRTWVLPCVKGAGELITKIKYLRR